MVSSWMGQNLLFETNLLEMLCQDVSDIKELCFTVNLLCELTVNLQCI